MTPIYIDRKRPQKNLWLRKRQAAEWHKKQDGIWMNFRTRDYGLRRRTAWKNTRRLQRRPPSLDRGWVSVKGTRDGRREQGSLSTRVHRVCIRLTSAHWEDNGKKRRTRKTSGLLDTAKYLPWTGYAHLHCPLLPRPPVPPHTHTPRKATFSSVTGGYIYRISRSP